MFLAKLKINRFFYYFYLKSIFFSSVHKIATHLTFPEKLELFCLTRIIKEKNPLVVEIGSYLGASSCFLAEGLKRVGCVVCIDSWQNDAMTEGTRDTFLEFTKNTKKFSNRIVAVRGLSQDVHNQIVEIKKPIHLLFIDGDHSYDSVKNDWDLYSTLLVTNSLIVMHDSGWAEGVKRVINEDIKKRVSYHKELPNMWWGIIA